MNFLSDRFIFEVHRPEVSLIAPPTPKKPQTKKAKVKIWIKDKWRDIRIRYYIAKIKFFDLNNKNKL